MPKIPLMKHAFLAEQETKKLLADFILEADRLSMGEQCAAFEEAFAQWQGRDYALLMNSGGSANLILLQALKNLGKLKTGDKVGFSAVTWSTNVMPIIQLGFIPVPIDCSWETLNSMRSDVEMLLTREPDCKAIFLTNVLGFTGDLMSIRELCDKKGVLLLEDSCEAVGAEIDGIKSGNFGLAATFSFYVAHHMSTIEGGMIVTDDAELAEMITITRSNGWDRNLTSLQQEKWRDRFGIRSEFDAKYTFYDLGFNTRPTEITGFLGNIQLQYIDASIKKRQEHYRIIQNAVQENPHLITVRHNHLTKLSPFAFPLLCDSIDAREHYLNRFVEADIEIRPMIAGNITYQPFYKKYVADHVDLPGADLLHTQSFYFGNYPELSDEDITLIRDCLKD